MKLKTEVRMDILLINVMERFKIRSVAYLTVYIGWGSPIYSLFGDDTFSHNIETCQQICRPNGRQV